jgi:hypothetical protein
MRRWGTSLYLHAAQKIQQSFDFPPQGRLLLHHDPEIQPCKKATTLAIMVCQVVFKHAVLRAFRGQLRVWNCLSGGSSIPNTTERCPVETITSATISGILSSIRLGAPQPVLLYTSARRPGLMSNGHCPQFYIVRQVSTNLGQDATPQRLSPHLGHKGCR